MSIWKHIRAIVLLPVLVTIVIPTLILSRTTGFLRGGGLPELDVLPFPLLGLVYLGLGLFLFVVVVLSFALWRWGQMAYLERQLNLRMRRLFEAIG